MVLKEWINQHSREKKKASEIKFQKLNASSIIEIIGNEINFLTLDILRKIEVSYDERGSDF